MTVDDVVAYARECLGTPFHHQGRVCGVGLDCAGVVAHVVERAGYSYTAPTNYGRQPFRGVLEDTLNSQEILHRVPLSDMQKGDILLMRFAKEPQHLAIYTGNGIIHAYETVKKCVEHGLDEPWQKRIVAVYRIKDI